MDNALCDWRDTFETLACSDGYNPRWLMRWIALCCRGLFRPYRAHRFPEFRDQGAGGVRSDSSGATKYRVLETLPLEQLTHEQIDLPCKEGVECERHAFPKRQV